MYSQQLRMKDLREEERPRERMARVGAKELSTPELLAILLRTGSKGENVLQLSHSLLSQHSLQELSRKRLHTLSGIHGIGHAKACQLLAAFELGKRLSSASFDRRPIIQCAKDIAKKYTSRLSLEKQEQLIGVYLDARQRIIKEEVVFVGTVNQTMIHPREIFQTAIIEGATGIIIVHNHPSGDPTPSEQDIEITSDLAACGQILGIDFVDHVIIGGKKFVSMQQEGHF